MVKVKNNRRMRASLQIGQNQTTPTKNIVDARIPLKSIVYVVFLLYVQAADADVLARADSLYLLRAEGATNERALRDPITEAITAYQYAASNNPTDLRAQWKLLRALFFQAQYTGYSRDERRVFFSIARDLGEKKLGQAAKTCGGKKSWQEGTRDDIAAYCDPDDAAHLYFWTAIIWAQWGRTYGAIAAVRAGLAGRLFAYANRVVELDPDCEQGGGLRLLSGLHAQLPKIPFVSSFVRREQALPLAERALAIDPNHPGNRFLYATTLLKLHAQRSEEARTMLKTLAAEKPSGPWRVEWQNLCRRAERQLDGDD